METANKLPNVRLLSTKVWYSFLFSGCLLDVDIKVARINDIYYLVIYVKIINFLNFYDLKLSEHRHRLSKFIELSSGTNFLIKLDHRKFYDGPLVWVYLQISLLFLGLIILSSFWSMQMFVGFFFFHFFLCLFWNLSILG